MAGWARSHCDGYTVPPRLDSVSGCIFTVIEVVSPCMWVNAVGDLFGIEYGVLFSFFRGGILLRSACMCTISVIYLPSGGRHTLHMVQRISHLNSRGIQFLVGGGVNWCYCLHPLSV